MERLRAKMDQLPFILSHQLFMQSILTSKKHSQISRPTALRLLKLLEREKFVGLLDVGKGRTASVHTFSRLIKICSAIIYVVLNLSPSLFLNFIEYRKRPVTRLNRL